MEHVGEFFRQVGHGDNGLELGWDFPGGVLSFFEDLSQGLDFCFGEEFLEARLSIEKDLHAGRVLQISDQRGFGQDGAKHAP